jgi:hypothetical protein
VTTGVGVGFGSVLSPADCFAKRTAPAAFKIPAPQLLVVHVLPLGKAVADCFNKLTTSLNLSFGLALNIKATAAATCGVAIEVPFIPT